MRKKRNQTVPWTPAGTEPVSVDFALLRARQGHGFAAERINHLKDVMSGKNAELVGGNNAKNGPDRIVNGLQIQTKYSRSGASCIAECFKHGRYRYLVDGAPMPVEVPSDKYEDALRAMARRIARGEVPGVNDPADAKCLVRRGFATYEQARNTPKFGTIDSLAYDAVNSLSVGCSAFGVAVVVSYARAAWRGKTDGALAAAWDDGLRSGTVAWAGSILASQLGRTRLGSSLGGNALTATATAIVLSSTHFVRLFRKEASGAQVFKDVATTTASVFGSAMGWQVGKQLGAGLGPAGALACGVVGALVAGNLCAKVVGTILDPYSEEDAQQMLAIAETGFQRLATAYRLTEYEATRVTRGFVSDDLPATLKEMHASGDPCACAEGRLLPHIEREVGRRGLLPPVRA